MRRGCVSRYAAPTRIVSGGTSVLLKGVSRVRVSVPYELDRVADEIEIVMPKTKPTTEEKTVQNRLTQVFEDGKNLFQVSVRSSSELSKSDCLVFLDTSTLLRPYEVSSKNLEELTKVLTSLSSQKRLRIAAHSAKEFFSNRTSILGRMLKRVSDRKSKASFSRFETIPLISGSTEFQKLQKAETKLAKAQEEYKSALSKVSDTIAQWGYNDPVMQLYRKCFTSDVVVAAPEMVENEIARRLKFEIPPGCRDAAKPTNNDGDVIIWLSILHECCLRKRSAIVVSNDLKDDWWEKAGDLRLSARFELLEEFSRRTNGNSFALITYPEFLELFGATGAVVEEERNLEKIRREHFRKRILRHRRGPQTFESETRAIIRKAQSLDPEITGDRDLLRGVFVSILSEYLPYPKCQHDRRIQEQILALLLNASRFGFPNGACASRIDELLPKLHRHHTKRADDCEPRRWAFDSSPFDE